MAGIFASDISRAGWEKVPARIRRLLLGVVAALLFWLGLVSFVLPQRATRVRLEREIESLLPGTEALRVQIEALESTARGEDALRRALAELRRQLEETLARVPENRALSSSLRDLTAPEDGDGVDIVSITPHPARQRDEILELPFTIELEGTYRSVTRYLARLEALPRLVTVQRVNLKSATGGQRRGLRASIEAATYAAGRKP